tara:strand:+ start:18795 stop:18992 length:198 start_codon:yes stop_codon:yes gene_type:complete
MSRLKKRYDSPTPKLFKKIGNALLASSTLIAGYSMFAGFEWVAIVAIACGVIGKFLTEFTTEDDK